MNSLIDDLKVIIEDGDKAMSVYLFLKYRNLFDEEMLRAYNIKRKQELCNHTLPDGKSAMIYIAGAGTCQICGWDDF